MIDNDPSNLGMITMANNSCARMFGYFKLELEKHSIDRLMPDIYRRYHSRLLERVLTNDPS